ncbi:LysM peptidoglycan-binding domain-containing protein [Kitasatospora sp. NBC_00374]
MTRGGAPAQVDTATEAKPAPKSKPAQARPAQKPDRSSTDATRSARTPTPSSPVNSPGAPTGTYTVKSGDTLSEIAVKFGTDVWSLYTRNIRTIGGDPDLIFPDQVLDL